MSASWTTRHSGIRWAVVVATALAIALPAAPARAADAAPVGGGTVSMSGVLASADGGVAGVTVYAVTPGGGLVAQTTSEPGGLFRLDGLGAEKDYLLSVHDPSFEYASGYATANASSPIGEAADAAPFTMSASGLSGAVVDMVRAVSLSGVLANDGDGVGDIVITAERDAPWFPAANDTAPWARTESDGSWAIAGLRPGASYRLTIRDDGRRYLDGYVAADGSITAAREGGRVFRPGSTITGIAVSLTELGNISGVVVTGGGERRTASIGVYGRQVSSAIASTTTAADGTFTVSHLNPALEYALAVSPGLTATGWASGGFVPPVPGAPLAPDLSGAGWFTPGTQGLTAVLGEAGQIVGTVTADGAPYRTGAMAVTQSGSVVGQKTAFVTDLQITRVPVGNVYVGVNRQSGHSEYAAAWFSSGGSVFRLSDATPVAIRPDEVSRVDIALQRCAVVSGRVTGMTAGALNFSVAFVGSGDPDLVTRSSSVQADGTYTVPGLTPGAYDAKLTYNDEDGYHTVFQGGATSAVDATDIVVSSCDAVAGPDLDASPRPIEPTAAPALDGIAQVGQTLTVSRGRWNVIAPLITYQWLRDGEPIPGAVASSYDVAPTDEGSVLGVELAVTKTGHASAAWSGLTAPVTAGESLAITTSSAPAIVGAVRVGSPLSATRGTWSVTHPSLTYQWLRDGVAIEGASSATYTPSSADLQRALAVRVVATKAGWVTGSFTTEPTVVGLGEAPTPTTPPQITGAWQIGSLLFASPGAWSVPGLTFSYQWLRDGVPIPGATGTSYMPAYPDYQRAVSVRVTASALGYATATATADSAGWINWGPELFPTTQPVVSGVVAVGFTLTVSPGNWSQPGVTFSYQWWRGGIPIGGANGPSYTLTPDDYTQQMWVQIRATKPGFGDGRVTTVRTASVGGPAARLTRAPTVSGSARVGGTLRASAGRWSMLWWFPSRLTYSYQWVRDGVPIPGATRSWYRVTGSDAGHRVSVLVTASRPGFGPGSAVATGKVIAKVRPTVVVSMPSTTSTAGGAVATVTVKSAAGPPVGVVTVSVRGTAVSAPVDASANGRVAVALPQLPSRGWYRVTVTFTPTGSSAVSTTSRTVFKSLRVR